MVTPSDASTAAGSADAPKNKGGNKGAKAGGKGGQAGAKGAKGAKGGGKKALSLAAVTRRVAAIQALEDAAKAKRSRQRLVHNLLSGIADGSVKQPSKAAQAVMSLMPKKATAEADDE